MRTRLRREFRVEYLRDARFTRATLQELGQLRQHGVQVAHDAEIGEVEDRRVRVLVDRDDRAAARHADLVLDRAGDAAGDVELRADRLAGLTDLRGVRVPAAVDDGARRRDLAAERARERLAERGSPRPRRARARRRPARRPR